MLAKPAKVCYDTALFGRLGWAECRWLGRGGACKSHIGNSKYE